MFSPFPFLVKIDLPLLFIVLIMESRGGKSENSTERKCVIVDFYFSSSSERSIILNIFFILSD